MSTAVQPEPTVPTDLPGLDLAWSRVVTAADSEGVERTWHLLDNGAEPVHGTVLCVHGNPTWSYLWRHVLAHAPDGWRVVAPDQLGMGYSERLRDDEPARTVAQRVADLGALTDALGIDGPVVTVGHDWGGMISLGWALEHQDQLRAVVVGNTAVAQPQGDFGPPLIRLAHLPGVRPLGCELTPIFVRATTALSRPALPREVRDAFAAPYADRRRRRSVGDFVADIPFSPGHPSHDVVYSYAERLQQLEVPALLLWGPRDPVFGEVYLRDLQERLPQAQVHRFEGASHLVTEDAPESAEAVAAWLRDLDTPGAEPPTRSSTRGPKHRATEHAVDPGAWTPWAELEARADDPSPVLTVAGHDSVSWGALARRVAELAAGFAAAGVRRGDRVGLLVEPSSDLVSVVYALWRAGAVVVVVDKGLGLAGMRRALRGSRLQHVVAGGPGLAAARAMGLPGTLVSVRPVSPLTRRALRVAHDLDGLAALGRRSPAPAAPGPEDDCAVLFTSGATGPAKGVVYRHRHFAAQVALVRRTYDLGPDDRFVAAFAPFALLGPALGLASAVPDVDVTAPDRLTAPLLADAVASVDARVVFASPAALRRVVATRDELTDAQRASLGSVRLLMSAGAPVPVALLRALRDVLPAASLHTPYGMTEALPVTDVSLEQIEAAGEGDGVCVGRPVDGVEVALAPLDGSGEPATGPGTTGEILVRGDHVRDRYDARWLTQRAASRPEGWHRTGDVGHLDDAGRLWVEGRRGHVVTTADGVVTPVGVEQRVESLDEVGSAAAVGVGPAGTQVLAVVVVLAGATATKPSPRGPLGLRVAGPDLTSAVRRVAGASVAAVLTADRLPLDVRHASKVDRTEVARQASALLDGR
ncbi:alpha/beta fold hydrolase [Nocardioides flavescens]|uniref:Alpha/beta fold hydrolase n=1 Tax=Nocardioides flavescens TaxID=2691959 RepID=A0A6L7F4K1_9ACTN|nr:alpha/beta fold hydrolase [Nocardioides flavescens]